MPTLSVPFLLSPLAWKPQKKQSKQMSPENTAFLSSKSLAEKVQNWNRSMELVSHAQLRNLASMQTIKTSPCRLIWLKGLWIWRTHRQISAGAA